jgi:hypothetical protein
MEIKKIGYDIEQWSLDIVCERCKSELVLNHKDLKTSDRKKYYCCKACGAYIEINSLGFNILLKQFVDRTGYTGRVYCSDL